MSQTAAPDALADRVDRMIRIGRLGAARPLVAALRRMGLQKSRLGLLEAKLALREGRVKDALAGLNQVIARDVADAALRKCRAEARLKSDDVVGAAEDAAEAVILDRKDPSGKALLGIVLIELKRYDDAVACLAEAVEADPDHPSYRVGLAEALARLERIDEAEATLEAAIARHPGRPDLRIKGILLRIRRRDFHGAIALAGAARDAGAADACVFGLLGHGYSSLGQHDRAAEAYREALKLCPEDAYVRHLVAASGAMPGADRAPPDYLRAVFNSYAERFEPHLITLRYRVPGLLRNRIIAELGRRETKPALLDLGCGTGLVGVTCADLALGPMTGVDISSSMLAKAREKTVYAELIEADIMQFLETDTRSWELVTAGDVFCYFGDLVEALTKLRTRMNHGGLLMFSLEELLPDSAGVTQGDGGRALGPLGRYSHSADYVRDCARCAGFSVEEIACEDLRRESDNPVAGLIVSLRSDLHA